MPKVELHRHLEGSVRLSTVIDEAKRHKIEMPSDDDMRNYIMCEEVRRYAISLLIAS